MRLALTTGAVLAVGALPLMAQTQYPLTLTNCGRDVSFDAAPDRAVTVGQSATEILYSLGLAPKVTGTSVWFNKVLPQFEDVNANIPRLADNDPSFESIVAQKPDLVAVQYEWHVGESGIVATRDMFDDVGVATYILPADCDTKDNSTGGDGTRTGAFDTAHVYKGITELGQIFDVSAQADTLVADLKQTETQAVESAQPLDLPDGLSAVFWFSSPDVALDPYVAGRLGAPGYMMSKLGIENVIESDEEWPTVGWTAARTPLASSASTSQTFRRWRATLSLRKTR